MIAFFKEKNLQKTNFFVHYCWNQSFLWNFDWKIAKKKKHKMFNCWPTTYSLVSFWIYPVLNCWALNFHTCHIKSRKKETFDCLNLGSICLYSESAVKQISATLFFELTGRMSEQIVQFWCLKLKMCKLFCRVSICWGQIIGEMCLIPRKIRTMVIFQGLTRTDHNYLINLVQQMKTILSKYEWPYASNCAVKIC